MKCNCGYEPKICPECRSHLSNPELEVAKPAEKSKFVKAEEVAVELDVSISYAYKVMRDLNKELKAKGFIVTAGRLSRKYFEERMYS